MNEIVENRRDFLGRAALTALSIPLLLGCRNSSFAQAKDDNILELIKKNAKAGLQWTGAIDVPDSVSSRTVIAGSSDLGEPLLISGEVFKQDGKTPAPNILIYFYHTDSKGLYGRNGQPRHGRYRGWLLTDKRGRYEFRTIKPASYPNSRNPAHIHMTLTSIDQKEDWIDTILFEGDEFITPARRIVKRGGFNPILKLKRNPAGILQGVRNIQL